MSKLPPVIEELAAPSEYMREVLATPPKWIVRWGELLVFLLVLGLLLLGWLIRYPDRITAEVIITTPDPPVPVVARTDGALIQLLVADRDTVGQGQLLAIVQNPAYYPHVVQLKEQLNRFDARGVVADSLFVDAYRLGSLQEAYAQLQRVAKDYRLYLRLTPHYQQQQAIRRQLRHYRALLDQKYEHQQLLERKVQLAERDFRRNQQLHASQTIADKALEDAERAWLEVRESYETLRTEVLQIQVQVANLEREGQWLGTQHDQTGGQLRITLITAVDQLQSDIAQWEERCLLIAPRTGRVSYSDFWSEQQFVQSGQTVMSVVPEEEQAVVAQLKVPVRNFGKVAVSQPVYIYLDNFPHQEYGALRGTVRSLSALPKQGYYRVTVAFPNGLTTQYGKQIPFTQQLSGRAEIVTEELRLLERFFYRLRAAVSTDY